MGLKMFKQRWMPNLMIVILAVWFVANLLSQLVYISINGTPYDGVAMLTSLGQIYYFIIAIEVILWLYLSGLLIGKLIKHATQNHSNREIGNTGELSKTTSMA